MVPAGDCNPSLIGVSQEQEKALETMIEGSRKMLSSQLLQVSQSLSLPHRWPWSVCPQLAR